MPGGVAVETPRPDPLDELARAQLAHQFRIDALLGRGEGSLVYLAREPESEQHIVVKVFARAPGRPDVESRFRDAVVAASAQEHPHLVPVLRHGVTDSLLWYSMEHRRARPLRDILRAGRLDPRALMRLVTQIGGALDYLHRRGVIHGRIKPENILVDADQWVYVCDAIIARAIHPAVQPTPGKPQATPPAKAPAAEDPAPANVYLPPEERGDGVVGHAADQFALAVLIHECLTGDLPARDATTGALTATFATSRPDLPVHMAHAIIRATHPRPMNRYPGILDLVTALESGSSMMVDARPSGRGSGVVLQIHDWKAPAGVRLRWLKPALFIGVVLAIGGGAVMLMNRPSDESGTTTPVTAQQSPASVDSTSPATRPPAGSTSVAPPTPGTPQAGDFSQRSRNRRSRGQDSAQTRSRTASAAPRSPAAASPPASAPAPRTRPCDSRGRAGWRQWQALRQCVAVGASSSSTAGPWVTRPRPISRSRPETMSFEFRVTASKRSERTVTVAAGETVRLTNLVLTPRP